jgi:hypothetical protein
MSRVFFFAILEDGQVKPPIIHFFRSHYFNITAPTQHGEQTPGATASLTPSPTPSPHASDESGSQRAPRLALAVGLGLGIPAVLVVAAIIGFCLLRRKGRNKEGAAVVSPDMVGDEADVPMKADGKSQQFVHRAAEGRVAPVELDGTQRRSELY